MQAPDLDLLDGRRINPFWVIRPAEEQARSGVTAAHPMAKRKHLIWDPPTGQTLCGMDARQMMIGHGGLRACPTCDAEAVRFEQAQQEEAMSSEPPVPNLTDNPHVRQDDELPTVEQPDLEPGHHIHQAINDAEDAGDLQGDN